VSDQAALGGVAEGSEAGNGGPGGAGNGPAGGSGVSNSNGGGGGGAVGRVRVNAVAPSVQGLVSPTQATGAFTTGALPLAGG
jgi:hypothetical protein